MQPLPSNQINKFRFLVSLTFLRLAGELANKFFLDSPADCGMPSDNN